MRRFLLILLVFLLGCTGRTIEIVSIIEHPSNYTGKNVKIKASLLTDYFDGKIVGDGSSRIRVVGYPSKEILDDSEYLIEGIVEQEPATCYCEYNVNYCNCWRIYKEKFIPPNESVGEMKMEDCLSQQSDMWFPSCEENSVRSERAGVEIIQEQCVEGANKNYEYAHSCTNVTAGEVYITSSSVKKIG